MNYRHYAARQLDVDKKGLPAGPWYYTVYMEHRDTGETTIAKVGYCADDCKGHDTAKEANAHQRKYQLDSASYGGMTPGLQQPCAVCGTLTDRFAETTVALGMGTGGRYPLCDAHCDRPNLSKVYGDVDEVISSH